MEFVLLVTNDESVELTADEVAARFEAFEAAQAEMEARGVLIERRRLRSTRQTVTVKRRNGELVLADGPFAETKEQIAGYYLVECKDIEEAIEVASLIPAADYGVVEVRPVWEM